MSTIYPSFAVALQKTMEAMRNRSYIVKPSRWQGIDVSTRPEAEMREILHWDFRVPMENYDVNKLREEIRPNLPWADQHFEERISGIPMNPGEAWKIWPWAHSADKFRDSEGRFEVSYMERLWSSQLGLQGIRGRPYGDLESIIQLLLKDPLTRQAYLPLYFPEDVGSGGRVMCSLGYHWIQRAGFLHVHYPIRSCDLYRHMSDDWYLCARLTLWLINRLKQQDPTKWNEVKPGYFSFWAGSLHCFVNDYAQFFGRIAP